MNSVKSTASETEEPQVEQTLPTIQELIVLAAQPRFAGQPSGVALAEALAMWRNASELLRKEAEFNRMVEDSYANLVKDVRKPKQWPTDFDTFLKRVVGGDRNSDRFPRFRKFLLYELRVNAHMKTVEKAGTKHRVKAEAEVEANFNAEEAKAKAKAEGKKEEMIEAGDKVRVNAKLKDFAPIRIDLNALDGPPDNSERDAVAKRFESYRATPICESEWDGLAPRYLRWWKGYLPRTRSHAGAKGAAAKGAKLRTTDTLADKSGALLKNH